MEKNEGTANIVVNAELSPEARRAKLFRALDLLAELGRRSREAKEREREGRRE